MREEGEARELAASLQQQYEEMLSRGGMGGRERLAAEGQLRELSGKMEAVRREVKGLEQELSRVELQALQLVRLQCMPSCVCACICREIDPGRVLNTYASPPGRPCRPSGAPQPRRQPGGGMSCGGSCTSSRWCRVRRG